MPWTPTTPRWCCVGLVECKIAQPPVRFFQDTDNRHLVVCFVAPSREAACQRTGAKRKCLRLDSLNYVHLRDRCVSHGKDGGPPPPKEEGSWPGRTRSLVLWKTGLDEYVLLFSPSIPAQPLRAPLWLLGYRLSLSGLRSPAYLCWSLTRARRTRGRDQSRPWACVDSSHAATCSACTSDRLWDVAQSAAGLPRGKGDLRTQTCGLFCQ